MTEPVLQAVQDAYWRRDADGYGRLLRLARRLTPDHGVIRRLWRRRWWPMKLLRAWDLLQATVGSERFDGAGAGPY